MINRPVSWLSQEIRSQVCKQIAARTEYLVYNQVDDKTYSAVRILSDVHFVLVNEACIGHDIE